MGLPHLSVLRLCILLVLTTLAGVTVLQATDSTIYEYLQNYGLPVGLFPKGITEFAIDTSDGRFQVYLPQPCVAKFENQVHYNLSVAGTLTFGQIGDLSGVLAQDLFLWFPVKGIHVDVPSSGLIYFDVGVVDKQFALSLFESPPDCTASDPDDPNFSPRPAYDQFLRNDLWADS